MNRPVFVFAQDEMVGRAMVHPQMIADLLRVASIDAALLEKLAAALLAQEGFLSETQFKRIVAESIPNEDEASSAASAIENLRSGYVSQALAMIAAWRDSSEANRARFTDEMFDDLSEKLPVLVQEYPALSRMRKADRLRGVVGNEFERVEFICDIRPVFDENRERVEGIVPITTMKVLFERQNGSDDEIEILLSPDDLGQLIAKAEMAKKKLQVMRESFSTWVDG